jgi:hypothetical protein
MLGKRRQIPEAAAAGNGVAKGMDAGSDPLKPGSRFSRLAATVKKARLDHIHALLPCVYDRLIRH